MRLTRYLYPAHRVCMALERDLVYTRDKHKAMYWAFELLHSGLLCDLLDTLWMIYRSKFQEVHPSFQQYMKKTLTPITMPPKTGFGYFMTIQKNKLL